MIAGVYVWIKFVRTFFFFQRLVAAFDFDCGNLGTEGRGDHRIAKMSKHKYLSHFLHGIFRRDL